MVTVSLVSGERMVEEGLSVEELSLSLRRLSSKDSALRESERTGMRGAAEDCSFGGVSGERGDRALRGTSTVRLSTLRPRSSAVMDSGVGGRCA